MMNENFREEAEKHWQFIEMMLKTYRGDREDTDEPQTVNMDCLHYLYVEAMIHGYKHALDEKGTDS
jgi:hypothetical protein